MPRYRVYAAISATKWIGEFEASCASAAIELAWKEADVSVCRECSAEVNEPEIDELIAEECLEDDEHTVTQLCPYCGRAGCDGVCAPARGEYI